LEHNPSANGGFSHISDEFSSLRIIDLLQKGNTESIFIAESPLIFTCTICIWLAIVAQHKTNQPPYMGHTGRVEEDV
jgi:hypothetical protein